MGHSHSTSESVTSFVETTSPLGKVAVIPNIHEEWNTNQAIAIYRLLDNKHKNYLLFYLLSEFAKNWFYVRSKQTSGQVNLTLEMCNSLEMPLPNSATEVLAISNRLFNLFEIVRIEHKKLSKLNEQKSGLMQDLLTGKVSVTP